MNYQRLEKTEATIQNGENQNYKLTPFSIPVKGENLKLDGVTLRPADGFTGYFYNEKFPKEKIVLHFTAGHLQGDLYSLTSKERKHPHVSVPFLIARDGTIYQLFSSAAWAYHLGPSAIGGNTIESRKSIAIELSNYGPLRPKAGNMETIYSRLPDSPKIKDIYCSAKDKDKYVKLDTPYREETYFATFTDEQYNSLITLLRYLTAQYDIPKSFLDEPDRYEATDKVINFKGILSHVNYRVSGKWDLGPAFDWERVIKGLQAEAFDEAGKIDMQIADTKTELKKAKRELKLAEQKVTDLEQKIQELETPPTEDVAQPQSRSAQPRSRSVGAAKPAPLKSEAAIEKALKQRKAKKGKAADQQDHGEEMDINTLSKFQL